VDEHSEEEAWALVESGLVHWEKMLEAEAKDPREGNASDYVQLARTALASARKKAWLQLVHLPCARSAIFEATTWADSTRTLKLALKKVFAFAAGARLPTANPSSAKTAYGISHVTLSIQGILQIADLHFERRLSYRIFETNIWWTLAHRVYLVQAFAHMQAIAVQMESRPQISAWVPLERSFADPRGSQSKGSKTTPQA